MREIESGILWINAPLLDNDALPFGGRKLSGTGRQLGPEGLSAVPEHQIRDDRSEGVEPGLLVVPVRRAESFNGRQ